MRCCQVIHLLDHLSNRQAQHGRRVAARISDRLEVRVARPRTDHAQKQAELVHVAEGGCAFVEQRTFGRDVVEEFLARILLLRFKGETEVRWLWLMAHPSEVDDDRSPYVTIRPRQQHVVLFEVIQEVSLVVDVLDSQYEVFGHLPPVPSGEGRDTFVEHLAEWHGLTGLLIADELHDHCHPVLSHLYAAVEVGEVAPSTWIE